MRVSNLDAKLDRKKIAYVARAADAGSAPFGVAADVPLKTGLNEIGVCARGKEEERCETAFVFKLPPPAISF